jgi:hypothetical protein
MRLVAVTRSSGPTLAPACGLLVLSILIGCATARVNHFATFSQAGVAYADAMNRMLDEAGTAAINADSSLLANNRTALDTAERGKIILEQNQALKERLTLLSDLRQHIGLVRSYFDALGKLAGSKQPDRIGSATDGVVKELNTLHGRIAGRKVGNTVIGNTLGAATNLVVGRFRLAALESELRDRADAISRELDLQEAALTLIARQMRVDLEVEGRQAETTEVVLPFVQDPALARNWKQRRAEILTASAATASAEAAAKAARKLKSSFTALVEGNYDATDIPSLLVDVNEVVTLLERSRRQ